MADISSFKFAQVRQMVLDAVRTDLIGPIEGPEEVLEKDSPTQTYITGILYPADSAVTEDENYNDIEFTNADIDADGQNVESSMVEDEKSEDGVKKGFLQPASIGVSFYIKSNVTKLNACVRYGKYTQKIKKEVIQVPIKETENGNGEPEYEEKTINKTYFYRKQFEDNLEIDLSAFKGSSMTYDLPSNPSYKIYVLRMILTKTNCTMVSVYIHNKDKDSGGKESEKVMCQVELSVSSITGESVFEPEWKCRNDELEDEFYYKGRPVYARGRGCAAIWEKDENSENAKSIKSSFIPDYEIAGVSSSLKNFSKKAFSMLYYGFPTKKEETISELRQLTSLYKNWIETKLKTNNSVNPEITNKIIKDCENALYRMNEGINLLETNTVAWDSFMFMNQSMYLQRSITNYSKEYGKGVLCALKDFMSDQPAFNREKDHSFWRPFQIAFILLNIPGIIDEKNPERNIVDLLYFPTGGGKTEAYLGLIAFTIGHRRLTANTETEFNKDGGVTVFLRYTLRLLTTQQRDRLLKLIIAMDIIREGAKNHVFGLEPISIGFWVGGSVTPNKFEEYDKEEIYNKGSFLRKVSKQVIRCPYCGTLVPKENFVIDSKRKTVEIFCKSNTCRYFINGLGGRKPLSMPVYLVDEEIYAKCPTVIISTVDKFARLPWSEECGLLFGKTDKICERCGHIAVGAEHESRHNASDGLPAAGVNPCKPFYPPELIVQDELHLITGPLGTIYGGYETVIEEMCSIQKDGTTVRPKYIVSTATIKNAEEQIRVLYAREQFKQFPPSGIDIRDSFFVNEIPIPKKNTLLCSEEELEEMSQNGENPFRKYVGICAPGQSVKTTLIRLYSVILQKVFDLSLTKEYQDYVDPYYTLIGYFNSLRELGGAKRLLDDDINNRIQYLQKKYQYPLRRFLNAERSQEITSRMPSTKIAETLERLEDKFTPEKEMKQTCYDTVIATNMIAVGMDVNRLGLMTVVGQPKQNSEYIQATSRVGRRYPGLIFTVYNPYRPRDLSNYENFVGFHSQMYRYVEGTTATPFAARARDRDLHALIVSLIRLQISKMAENKGASFINDIPESEIEAEKNKILERVKKVSPSAYSQTIIDLNNFISTWKDVACGGKLFYHVKDRTKGNRTLLTYYTDYANKTEKPTLISMRDVEKASSLYLWEGDL